ncbi:hypothetical protein ES703_41668 [subsurface metagenome]
MRWKFWERQPDFFEEIPRARRPRETLAQTAEKILQRKMKADPDVYPAKQSPT